MKAFLRLAAGAIVVGLIAIVATAGWFWNTAYRDRSSPSADTRVVIERGATFSQVAKELAAAGIINNVLAFRLLARMRRVEADAHAGEYRFPAHQTQDEVLKALVTGGAQVAAWVTIPEGFTADQIAQRLEENGVGSGAAFVQAFKRDWVVAGGTRSRGLEGFLFPSTYLMPLGASTQQVETLMTDEFFKQLPRDAAARARALHVSVPQVVTVASLVEREAKADLDRPTIAGVIYNRLKLGMPLQVDATIEYALPHHKAELSFADLKIDSPYNSYTHAGLPPTPIANPGRPSLQAAFYPSKTDDLYYVYCGKGRHVFAKTLAEHQANVARCLQ